MTLDKIDMNMIKRPNKPFNKNTMRIIAEANTELEVAKSDVASKDYASGKNAIDRVNGIIKDALRSEPNDIQLYQISMLQEN
jgi:hypothetical protein